MGSEVLGLGSHSKEGLGQDCTLAGGHLVCSRRWHGAGLRSKPGALWPRNLEPLLHPQADLLQDSELRAHPGPAWGSQSPPWEHVLFRGFLECGDVRVNAFTPRGPDSPGPGQDSALGCQQAAVLVWTGGEGSRRRHVLAWAGGVSQGYRGQLRRSSAGKPGPPFTSVTGDSWALVLLHTHPRLELGLRGTATSL